MSMRGIPLSIVMFINVLALAGRHAAAQCDPNPPGFEVTWETSAGVLKNKLLAGPLPPGVTITGATITPAPAAIGQNETIGYYSAFNLNDNGAHSLSIPDGVILTTGTFVNNFLGFDNYINWCNDDHQFYYDSGDAGDTQIQALYAASPLVHDGVSLNLTFTSDATIGGLRFKMILASDEFPEYADDMPAPAVNSQSGQSRLMVQHDRRDTRKSAPPGRCVYPRPRPCEHRNEASVADEPTPAASVRRLAATVVAGRRAAGSPSCAVLLYPFAEQGILGSACPCFGSRPKAWNSAVNLSCS